MDAKTVVKRHFFSCGAGGFSLPLGPYCLRMSRTWKRNIRALAAMTLAAGLCAGPTAPGAAQEEKRPAARDVPSRKVIRTQRLRVPADLFKQDAVSFKRARVDASGTIRADGHNLDLYGAVLIRRDRLCASPEAGRVASAPSWPCERW
jgi:hypothetical protein